MTRRLVLSTALMLAFAASALSQDRGFEVFGGYSYQNTGSQGVSQGMNGFNVALTGNMSKALGITGEVSRHSWGMSMVDPLDASVIDVNTSVLGFRVGPKLTSHMGDTASVFVQPTVGFYRMSASSSVAGFTGSTSATGFTTAAGGGLDLRVSPRISVRPAQIDWIYLGSADIAGVSTGSSNGFRYSGGVVVKF
jgi:hypothetical protein